MKNKIILLRLEERRFEIKLRRRKKKARIRRIAHQSYIATKHVLHNDFSYENILTTWLPVNIKYLLNCNNSGFSYKNLKKIASKTEPILKVPSVFSIIDNRRDSYKFIEKLTAALITQKYREIKIDYSECIKLDLGTQVFVDIIIKEIFDFFNKCDRCSKTKARVYAIQGVNINNIDVKKLLFSVGSPAIHTNKCLEFDDIIPYKLCSYNRRQCISITSSEQKDIDTTRLVDYVLDSLRAVNKSLSPEKIDDLCTVIGETLINAEEHSTTKCRFSIGYFHKINSAETQCGVLRLAIFNFGKSIYEKFKDPDCQNKYIVNKMKELSDKYTKRNLFQIRTFEEETLWTLYALQEGVTSVAPEEYRKRGNGSIQFIESFFNMKTPGKDKISRMTILSGNASITFDGTYKIVEKKVNDDQYKFMTFNKSGNIEDSPDNNFVRFVDDYFPGTLISVEILFNGENMYHE